MLCGLTVERSLAILKVRISAGPLPGNSLGQAAHTHVALSPSSIIWYRPMGGDALFGWEGNGSLPLGGWFQVTCGLTACTPGSAPGPTFGNEYGRTLLFPRDVAAVTDFWRQSAKISITSFCTLALQKPMEGSQCGRAR